MNGGRCLPAPLYASFAQLRKFSISMEPKEDNPETLGQLAFNAYNESKGGTTWDGRPIPKWADLGSEVQTAWEASATLE